jgi:hypothetical protein
MKTTIKLFTHDVDETQEDADGQAPLIHTEHTLFLPRQQAVEVARIFYGGEGYTSVHEDTLNAFTPEERLYIGAG